MTWTDLLTGKRVAAEPTSKQELDELREMAALNLKDAHVAGVSAGGGMSLLTTRPVAISDTETDDLVRSVAQFRSDAEAWIRAKNPALA